MVLTPPAGGAWAAATIRSGLLTPAAATPSLASASLAPTPAIAAAAAAPRENCSMKVLLEISEWTKDTAHPPCLALGRLLFYVPVYALCPGDDPPDASSQITPFSSFPRLSPCES